MRVLFLQECPLVGGGASTNALRKVNLLQSLGHETKQFSYSATGAKGRRLRLAQLVVSSFIRGLRTDVVYARMVPRCIPVALVFGLAGKPVVLEANGKILDGVQRPWVRVTLKVLIGLLLRRRSVLVCGDDGHKDYVLKCWGHANWKRLPLGIDELAVRTRGNASLRNVVLFAGQITKRQGIYELAQAVHRLRNSGNRLDLVIYGAGPEASDLERLLVRFGMQGALRGQLPPQELKSELEAARVLVAPYLRSSFPEAYVSSLKVLEYMVTTRPVVVPSWDSAVVELDLGPNEGVFKWDGHSVPLLAEQIAAAVDATISGAAIAERVEKVIRSRGTLAQEDALRAILESATSPCQGRST